MKKLKIEEIYEKAERLKTIYGFEERVIYTPVEIFKGKKISFPIKSYCSPKQGSAIWEITGVHGEEIAGPNAIARNIDFIGKIGNKFPVIVFPLCNPHGYYKGWRSPYKEIWKPGILWRDVHDSGPFIPDEENPSVPREKYFSCPEARALSEEIVRLSEKYPPKICFNFHEDVLSDKGYIYAYGTNDSLKKYFARQLIKELTRNKVKIKKKGKTRFNEPIEHGIIWDSFDGSIDHLMVSKVIFYNGQLKDGPDAKAVFVIETPGTDSLEKRVNAHSSVLLNTEEVAKQTLLINAV